jgi:hypothetical protein
MAQEWVSAPHALEEAARRLRDVGAAGGKGKGYPSLTTLMKSQKQQPQPQPLQQEERQRAEQPPEEEEEEAEELVVVTFRTSGELGLVLRSDVKRRVVWLESVLAGSAAAAMAQLTAGLELRRIGEVAVDGKPCTTFAS